jgi:MtN3 and saliva related transmembrane protein
MSSTNAVALVGFLAGCITVVSFIPQVLQVWRTRRTQDLSLGAFGLLASGAGLWLLYGILTRDWPVIVTNSAVGILVGAILVAKLRFE